MYNRKSLQTDNGIKAWAALIKNDDREYDLVTRWFLGGREEEKLPRPNDEFLIKVYLTKSKLWLHSNGDFKRTEPTNKQIPCVFPRQYAMLAPPQTEIQTNYNEELKYSRKFLVYKRPEQPIELICSANGDRPEQGFGIFHLLCEANKMRQMWRSVNYLVGPIETTLKERSDKLAGFQGLRMAAGLLHRKDYFPETAQYVAMNFAHQLANGLPRPMFIRKSFHTYVQVLNKGAAGLVGPRETLELENDLFAIGSNTVAEKFEYAAVLGSLVNNTKLMEELDQVNKQADRGRKQLRLSSMNGGNLIDFWCSPDSQEIVCDDQERGKLYSGAELMGLGKSFGPFSEDLIKSWVQNQENIEITISNNSPELTVKHWEIRGELTKNKDADAGFFLTKEDTRAYDSFVTKLLTEEIRSAKEQDSSRPIIPPKRAWIDYDLTRLDGKREKKPQDAGGGQQHPQFGYGTGDGKIKILIKHPDKLTIPHPETGQQVKQQTVFGFNVYGMWRTKETESFFVDLQKKLSVNQLKPWLITRRYSYELELKPALRDHDGQEISNLQAALNAPPWMPHFIRPRRVLDKTPEGSESGDNSLLRQQFEELPDPDSILDVTPWMFDLRTGMDSGKNEDKFVGWDPSYWVKESWRVDQDRDGNLLNEPQEYRFWVTSVDAFDQESEPIEVRANDFEGQEEQSFVYKPRNRTSMLSPNLPPVGNEMPNGSINRGLLFNHDRQVLELSWETPLLSDISSTGENSTIDRMVNKDDLIFEYVVFCRILRRSVQQDEHIAVQSNLWDFPEDMGFKPHWVQTIRRMEKTGWRIFKKRFDYDPSNVSPHGHIHEPKGGREVWNDEIELSHHHFGYEYIAAVAARIKDGRKQFWAPDAMLRTVRVATGDEIVNPRPEIVSSSNISTTSEVVIPNDKEPRGLKSGSFEASFHRARPILSPPGIRRDYILMRLLAHDFMDEDEQKLGKIEWAGTRVELSYGQKAMCEAALARIYFSPKDPSPSPPLNGKEWILTRQLLASDFGREVAEAELRRESDINALSMNNSSFGSTVYRQNKTMGFRGVVRLKWRYTPNVEGAFLETDEAEAVKIRIHGVRVPLETPNDNIQDSSSANYASITTPVELAHGRYGIARRIAGESIYRLEVPSDQKEKLATLAHKKSGKRDPKLNPGNQPGLVRIDTWEEVNGGRPDKSNPIFGVIANKIQYEEARDEEGRPILRCDVALELENLATKDQLPEHALIRIYTGQPLALIDTNLLEEELYDYFLPVGGGRREVFCWWISTVSSQEREATNTRRKSFILRVPETVEPLPPINFRADEPFDSKTHDIDFPTDPNVRKWLEQFLPKNARSETSEEASPRIVLSWGRTEDLGPSSDQDSRGIHIEREWVTVKEENNLLAARNLSNQRTAWEALKEISVAPDNAILKANDVDLLWDQWLLGNPIQIEEDFIPQNGSVSRRGTHLDFAPRPSSTDQLTRRLSYSGLMPVAVGLFEKGGGLHEEHRPGFIDMYKDNFDSGHIDEVMDRGRVYRYRLKTYIDLQELETKSEIPRRWRYLSSPPTHWSNFVPPGLPLISLISDEIESETLVPDLILPQVCFKISSELTPMDCVPAEISVTESEVSDWYYRVIIQRRLPFALTADPNTVKDMTWGDIGNIIIGPTDCGVILDRELERDEWDEPIELEYRIKIKQIYFSGPDRTETLIRSYEERLMNNDNAIRLRAPISHEKGEIELTYKIKID